MKQPDMRAKGGGRPGESLIRREEYRSFRESQVHSAWRGNNKQCKDNCQIEVESPAPTEEFTWVSTPTGERVLAGLRFAQFAHDISVIYGGAGLGKSHSIRHYRNCTPSVFLVELSPAAGSINASLVEICRALGLYSHDQRTMHMHRSICAKLSGTKALLVIDEAQELSMRALDQVRCIHDQTKVGIALVGNEQVYAQMAGHNRPAYLDRLYSRIGKRIHLPSALPGDAVALVESLAIGDSRARARLYQIGSRPGALRLLQKVARLASVYAASEVRSLCLEDIESAWIDLGGIG